MTSSPKTLQQLTIDCSHIHTLVAALIPDQLGAIHKGIYVTVAFVTKRDVMHRIIARCYNINLKFNIDNKH